MVKVTEAHLEARRDDILNAALAVFAREGAEGASMPDIADEAGLSVGAIYRYFDGKEALFHACCQRAQDEAVELLRDALERGPNDDRPLAWLEHAGVAIFENESTVCSNPALMLDVAMYSCRDDAEWGPKFRATQRRAYDQLRDGLAAEQAAGVLAADIDINACTTLLYALVPGLRMTSLEIAGSAAGQDVMSLVTDLLRRTGQRKSPAVDVGRGG